MIGQEPMSLEGTRLQTGEFLLWATDDKGLAIPFPRLKNRLFAWDRRSFFGATIRTMQTAGRLGLLLPPFAFLQFLKNPLPAVHAHLDWSPQLVVLRQAAHFFQEVLVKGEFVPSFASWKEGRWAWELRLSAEREVAYQTILHAAQRLDILYLDTWFAAAVADALETEPEVVRTWGKSIDLQRLTATLSDSSAILGSSEFLAEDDWLEWIGWEVDETPFRTCLQLTEPELEADDRWQLRLLLQDNQQPELLVEIDSQARPLASSFPEHWLPFVKQRVAKDVAKISRIVPWLELDKLTWPAGLRIDDEQAWELLNQDSLRLVQAGISLFLPAWWEEIKQVRPKLKAKLQSSVGASSNPLLGLDQLMHFDWKLAVGDIELTEQEFWQLASAKKRLLLIRGQWIQLNPSDLSQIQKSIKQIEKKGLSLRDVLEMHWLGTDAMDSSAGPTGEDANVVDRAALLRIEVELNRHLQRFIEQLQSVSSIPLVEPPAGLHAELRAYQQAGVSWLLFLRQYGLGGCLADDMGLGKTIQFISYLLASRQAEGVRRETASHSERPPALLICPTSVLGNWQKELDKFAPSLQVYLHYGPQRSKGESFAKAVAGYDLVMTSYTLAHFDKEELASIKWDTICLDEAQNIKNAHTKQRMSIRKLKASHRISLTGTPIENRLTELWSIFDFLNPGYLGNLRTFTQKFASGIEKTNDPVLIGQVQKLIRPFLLRRLKKDPAIQLDLPEKNEMKSFVSLTPEQGALYENVIQDLFEALNSVTGMAKKGLILRTLTKLKQACDHPSLLLKDSGNAIGTARSNKMVRLLEMVEELREEGDKCLIFTQFVEMGHLLHKTLEQKLREPVLFLHGGLPKTKRDQLVAQFQETSGPLGQGAGVFILSLKAGGTGLNLTAANHVFHFDRWWNPAVEDQATDRAFRIGQTRDVQVHKFVTLGTLEERIDEMIDRKKGLSQQIVGGGENWITELSDDELKDLFVLRKEWIEK